MQDLRWLRLRDRLLDRGWTTRDDALHAPHDTLWFSRNSDHANMATFRRRMTLAAQASAAYVGVDDDHAALHEDLVSLVEALDEVCDDDAAAAGADADAIEAASGAVAAAVDRDSQREGASADAAPIDESLLN